jgi:hypothetical protein
LVAGFPFQFWLRRHARRTKCGKCFAGESHSISRRWRPRLPGRCRKMRSGERCSSSSITCATDRPSRFFASNRELSYQTSRRHETAYAVGQPTERKRERQLCSG